MVGDHPCEAWTSRSERCIGGILVVAGSSLVSRAAPGNSLMVHSACLVTPVGGVCAE